MASMMELVALSIPWVLALIIVMSVVLLVFKKWKIAVVMILLAVIGNWQYRCLPINFCGYTDERTTLTVLTYNSNLSPLSESVSERRQALVDMIEDVSPDVMFITENFFPSKDLLWKEIKGDYPYCSKSVSSVGNKLYSKYPLLVDIRLSNTHMASGVNYCRIDYLGLPLDVFGVHLSSNNYNENMEYLTPDSVSTGNQARTYLKNIMYASECRTDEVEKMVEFIESKPCSGSTIVMGDFNDVCRSPALKILESSCFKDAWWEGGMGYGATISNPLPFRIDHIMYKGGLKLRSIKKVNVKGLSDHSALVATFSIE